MSLGGFFKNLIRFVPVILGLIPKANPYKDLITAAVTLAEESGLPGKDKKKIARDALIVSIQTANHIHEDSVNEEVALQIFDDNIDKLIKGVKSIPVVEDKKK